MRSGDYLQVLLHLVYPLPVVDDVILHHLAELLHGPPVAALQHTLRKVTPTRDQIITTSCQISQFKIFVTMFREVKKLSID